MSYHRCDDCVGTIHMAYEGWISAHAFFMYNARTVLITQYGSFTKDVWLKWYIIIRESSSINTSNVFTNNNPPHALVRVYAIHLCRFLHAVQSKVCSICAGTVPNHLAYKVPKWPSLDSVFYTVMHHKHTHTHITCIANTATSHTCVNVVARTTFDLDGTHYKHTT